jgi:CubicO group peptidase (beta-lactamase class C family)
VRRKIWWTALAATTVAATVSACSSGSDGGAPAPSAVSESSAPGGADTATSEPDDTTMDETTAGSTAESSAAPESGSSTPPTNTGGLAPTPLLVAPATFDDEIVQQGLEQLPGIVGDAMESTGVPGVAVGVVYKDEVVFAEGYGVRRVGADDPIDTATVFQVASMSKPVSSTIVAGVVGQGKANWTDPVRTWYPDYAMSDPFVTENATLADQLSHRTGLYTGSGDLLEDLRWDQEHILPLLVQQPLDAFRSTYNYSNYGYTYGGLAAAAAAQQPWADLADSMLLEPLGMTSSSYRHADYVARENRASLHTRVGPAADKNWEPRDPRDPDAEAPAGGLSTSVDDMTQFVRLQLANGTVDGRQIIDGSALQVTHVPHNELFQPTTPGERTQFYGLGWNITYDGQGRTRYDHSGAFLTGAATTVTILPTEQLGIVTLTNGQPHGIPESINDGFIDVLRNGHQTVAWLDFYAQDMEQKFYTGAEDPQWDAVPTNPAPSAAETAYLGTYQNPYYGPLTVSSDGGALSMSMGPPDSPTRFLLTPFDGNTFTFDTIGENANGKSGAEFTLGPDGTATSVTLTFYDQTGLGTFTR